MAFYPPSNYITLTLNTTTHPSGLGTGDLSITVNEDISTLQTQGWLNLDRALPGSREIVKWTSYDAGTKTFTVLRAQDGTTAHTHATTCTITVSGVKAYWDSLKSYVDTLFTAPPAIGSTTPAAATFTTLTTTGNATIGGATTFTGAVTFSTPAAGAFTTLATSGLYTASGGVKIVGENPLNVYESGSDAVILSLTKADTPPSSGYYSLRLGSGASATTKYAGVLKLYSGNTSNVEPGVLEMHDKNNVRWYLHVSTAGKLYIDSDMPVADTSGTVVGTQT